MIIKKLNLIYFLEVQEMEVNLLIFINIVMVYLIHYQFLKLQKDIFLVEVMKKNGILVLVVSLNQIVLYLV